ncbi:DUF3885 domain-containing protein [Leptospira weilii]|uniref:DUF3885 domain-containing protein n=1 Tax=Leptospira weilii TaxID=28184 RepID=UPI000AC3D8E9|nr:hypothetical protein [Leptospira weilii]MCL8268101.1 hypothetical protein [Leptospira weilii]MDL5246645.1 hypothetical protein [Leptospira weilii]QDK21869.1 hypothetical protein FHG67_03280 [Leptospira weilii]QDK25807.1 hypothetical protein FHG68_03135 [Leptospira weilii]
MKSKFDTFWDLNFPNCPPISHLFRDLFSSRWVRIHTLPESKRYSENESEMQIILDGLLDQLNEIHLLVTSYSGSEVPFWDDQIDKTLLAEMKFWRSIAMHKLSDNWIEPTHIGIFLLKTSRGRKSFSIQF